MLNGGHFNFRKNKCWKCRRWLWLIHCHFCYSYCLESGLTNEKRRRSSEKSDSRPGCVKSSEILATSTCSVMQQPLQWCFDSVKELKHSVFYSSNVGTSCRLVLSIQQLMRSATWQELVRSQAVTNRKCLSGKTPSMGTNDVLFCHIITLWKKNNPPFIFFYIIFNRLKHGVHLLHHCAVERLFFYRIGHFKCRFEKYEMRRAGSKRLSSIVSH